jgi:hypothetical protein
VLGGLGGLGGLGQPMGKDGFKSLQPKAAQPKVPASKAGATKQQTITAAFGDKPADMAQMLHALNEISANMAKLSSQADNTANVLSTIANNSSKATTDLTKYVESLSDLTIKSFKQINDATKRDPASEVVDAQESVKQIVDVIDAVISSEENMVYLVIPGYESDAIVNDTDEVIKAIVGKNVRVVGSVKALATNKHNTDKADNDDEEEEDAKEEDDDNEDADENDDGI